MTLTKARVKGEETIIWKHQETGFLIDMRLEDMAKGEIWIETSYGDWVSPSHEWDFWATFISRPNLWGVSQNATKGFLERLPVGPSFL